MIELYDWILGAIIITTASTVQSITGFGFALVAVPFLMFIFDPKTAVGHSMIISFCSLFILLMKVKSDTQWGLAKTLFLGALLGLPAGAFVFYTFELSMLKILINVFIVVLSLIMIFKIKFKVDVENKKCQIIVGAISGFLTSSLGMPGPPIILFLSNLNLPKGNFRATTVAYFVLIYPVSFIINFISGALPPLTFFTALTLVPFTFLGVFIGSRVFDIVPADKFKKIVILFLVIIGVYSIVTTLL